MIYQLITPTITGKDAILYQTGSAVEIEVIRERYESMLWEVEVREIDQTGIRHYVGRI